MATTQSSKPNGIIKYAFAIESVINILGGGLMIAAPTFVLNLLSRSPSFISPLAELLLQLAGGLVCSFTAPLVLGLRAGPREKIMAYQFLAVGEGILVPLLVGKWALGSDSGLSDNSGLLIMAGNLVPFVIFRIWCLGWKIEWFGKEKGAVRLE